MSAPDLPASGDAAEILRQEEIRDVLRTHLPAGVWTDLRAIYEIVEANAALAPADLDPSAAGASDPRWHRNVRNLLQRWKDSEELEWDGDARYRRTSSQSVPTGEPTGGANGLVGGSVSKLPSARLLLERLRDREIRTVTGAINRILEVQNEAVVVATGRSPNGQSVPIVSVQAALDLLARDREVAVTPEVLGYRSAFVGAVLLTLPGTSAEPGSPPRIVLLEADRAAWHLAPGETIRRVELHDIYGGSRQGGTIPSRTSPNILLFLDRAVGNPHGYFDGWVGDRFYYTGHGQRGDQELRAGNGAVLRHQEDGRAIRVFRGAGGVVRYLGQFALDEEQPYFRMEAPESETGLPRQVIVFRLVPVGAVLHDPEDDLDLPDGVTAPTLDAIVSGRETNPEVVRIPIENQNVEEVQVSRTTESYTAIRREQGLVLDYAQFLERIGSTVSRFRVQPPGEARAIVCDVYDETRNNLVEAKGTGARGEIRMAIGQLTDYGRFCDPAPALAVLLPTRPRSDLEALLSSAAVSAVWPVGDGFEDNAGGRFV